MYYAETEKTTLIFTVTHRCQCKQMHRNYSRITTALCHLTAISCNIRCSERRNCPHLVLQKLSHQQLQLCHHDDRWSANSLGCQQTQFNAPIHTCTSCLELGSWNSQPSRAVAATISSAASFKCHLKLHCFSSCFCGLIWPFYLLMIIAILSRSGFISSLCKPLVTFAVCYDNVCV